SAARSPERAWLEFSVWDRTKSDCDASDALATAGLRDEKTRTGVADGILQRSWTHLPCHEGAVRHGAPAADRLRRAPPRRKALAVNIACRGRKKHAWRNCLGRAPWRRWSGFGLCDRASYAAPELRRVYETPRASQQPRVRPLILPAASRRMIAVQSPGAGASIDRRVATTQTSLPAGSIRSMRPTPSRPSKRAKAAPSRASMTRSASSS